MSWGTKPSKQSLILGAVKCTQREALYNRARHPSQLGSDAGRQVLSWEDATTTTQDLNLWKVDVLGPGAEVAAFPVGAQYQE